MYPVHCPIVVELSLSNTAAVEITTLALSVDIETKTNEDEEKEVTFTFGFIATVEFSVGGGSDGIEQRTMTGLAEILAVTGTSGVYFIIIYFRSS